ncbi:MAG: ABC transporter permease [Bacillota bacterium]|nr:ABC transporter permease [Bacillota bacterium]HOA91365.1 ABC transporter permease [Bacillota bacterium]HOJ45858.1 ABC transporter permease [Bacillota bacterium]HPQ10272.1 ABC transporter permease [Bacillota bacterium]HPZ73314.1 ABC transporter permease [Bacillota bacterium]
MVCLAIYAVFAIPYEQAVKLWRGDDKVWADTPRNARPVWFNWFYKEKQPVTINLNSAKDPSLKSVQDLGGGMSMVDVVFEFDYNYDGFPSEISLFFTSKFNSARPNVDITWITPDGREIPMSNMALSASNTYTISQDNALSRRLRGVAPEKGLFADPNDPSKVVKGTYKMVIEGLVFEEGADYDAKLVVYGKLHGLAGTDHRRRDITIALLWGTPVALSFGLLAAVGSSLITMMLAAAAVWFGGWVDAVIRRINEIVMILPLLPILIMVGLFYSRSIWAILGVVILLGIFGSSILSYRSMFLQVKQSGYIEAARAYGASSGRIIFRYMIPKVIPVLIPGFVTQVPSYVFLEATLAVLNLGDPLLPTWGKLLNDAYSEGALFTGHFYWVLQPAILLVLTGLGFAMLGFALDRIFNPRLRGL